MRIEAAVVRARGGPFTIETIDLNEPGHGEVLVRIVGVGLCDTDLKARDLHVPVTLPAVLGHEGSGVVERVGPGVTTLVPGDAVVLTYPSCGRCGNCEQRAFAYCAAQMRLCFGGRRGTGAASFGVDGVAGAFFGQSSFASHVVVGERSAVKVARGAPLDQLGPLGCGVQTGVGTVLNVLRPAPRGSIAIFGLGAVGLAAVMAARITNCGVIAAVDPCEDRLKMAGALGATHLFMPEGAGAAVDKLTRGGAGCALVATGRPEAVREAMRGLVVRGTCALVGVAPLGTDLAIDMRRLLPGRTLRGVLQGDSVPADLIPRMVKWHADGQLPFDRLLSFYRLADINDAARDVERAAVIKAVLRP